MSRERSRPNRRFSDRVLRRLVWRRLEKLEDGRLVIDDGGERREFGRPGEDALAAKIEIRDPRFYRHLVFGGSLGAAEAYIRGYWTCDDLVSLVRIFCRNAAVSAGLERGPARIAQPAGQDCPLVEAEYVVGKPPQHRRPLRPGQRVLLAVPRRDHGLFLRDLSAGREHTLRGVGGQVRPHLPQAGPDGG